MSAFGAHVDDNQQFSIGGVVGTLGTADEAGTAKVLPIGVNPATGAMYVQDLSGASGTTTVQMVSGTLNVGTVVVSSSSGGTTVNVATGTQQTLGTVGVLNSGTINLGTVVNSNLTKLGSAIFAEDAALTTPQLVIAGAREDGSGGARALLVDVNSGGLFVTGDTDAGASDVGFPIKTGGKAGTAEPTAVLNAQRVNAYFDQFGYQYVKVGAGTSVAIINSGTITTGSLSNVAMINAGTVNANLISSTGTIPLITTVSNLTNGSVNVLTGTTTLVSTVTTLSNLTNGSVNILTGTLQSSGTTTGVGVVSNVTNGSINILTGTLQSSGTTTGVGVVSALTVGTIGGKAASGAAAVANPVLVGGTDSGGTVYVPLVTTGGILAANMPTGTVTTGTLALLTTVSNLTNGSVVMTVGTMTAGSLTNVGQIHNAGTLAAGGNNIGDVDIATGTVTLVSTVTTLSNLTNGSVNVLTGTVTRASNVGTLESGTVKLNNTPAGSAVLTSNTLGTAGAAAFWGTLLAPVGAGTFAYLTGFSVVVHSGTPEIAITNNVAGSTGAGVITRGVFPPGGGIARDLFPVYNTVANGTIAYMINAGTASFNITYWVSP